MKEEIWFSFLFGADLPRTTTKWEYKQLSRWLRLCRREVSKIVNPEKLRMAFMDTMVYGTGIVNL